MFARGITVPGAGCPVHAPHIERALACALGLYLVSRCLAGLSTVKSPPPPSIVEDVGHVAGNRVAQSRGRQAQTAAAAAAPEESKQAAKVPAAPAAAAAVPVPEMSKEEADLRVPSRASSQIQAAQAESAMPEWLPLAKEQKALGKSF